MIRKILVSQPQPTSPKSPYAEIAGKYGVEFTFRPFIKIEGVSVMEFRKQRVDILKHTAIVFTSRHAIDHFFSVCAGMRLKMPETMKYFATSESVALYIQKFVQYRKRKVFFAETGKAEDLVPLMAKHKGESFLIPQNDMHNEGFAKLLDTKGVKHTECVMYRTVSVPVTKEEVFSHGMVVLFTAAGVETLVGSFPGFEQGMLRIATLGNAARLAAESHGLRVDIVAPLPKMPSITGAIAQYLEEETERDRAVADQAANIAPEDKEGWLRRSVAAKKGVETKRRKVALQEEIEQLDAKINAAKERSDKARKTAEGFRRESDAVGKEIAELQKNYDELRRNAERSLREGEKARREMREHQAKLAEIKKELDDINAQISLKKGKGGTDNKPSAAKTAPATKIVAKQADAVKAAAPKKSAAKPKAAADSTPSRKKAPIKEKAKKQ
ncbi:MAG: uroporphyrinogen-III synthase [Bacteroidaceae bacterium]|nr:uroporphyrinogen-III synthase [Bacteroidaceae bacterium]